MKKKLLSFVIAAAMVMGIPAALGSAGLNMPDEVTVAPVTANAKTTTSSVGSTRKSATKATISAYENDRIDIKISILKELAEILRTSVSYLAEGKMDEIDSDILQIAVLLNGIVEEDIRTAALNVTMIMLALDKKIK